MFDYSKSERVLWFVVGLLGLAGGVFFLAATSGDSAAYRVLWWMAWVGVAGNGFMLFTTLPAGFRLWLREVMVPVVLVYGPIFVAIYYLTRLG